MERISKYVEKIVPSPNAGYGRDLGRIHLGAVPKSEGNCPMLATALEWRTLIEILVSLLDNFENSLENLRNSLISIRFSLISKNQLPLVKLILSVKELAETQVTELL